MCVRVCVCVCEYVCVCASVCVCISDMSKMQSKSVTLDST